MNEQDYLEEEAKKKQEDDEFYHRQLEEQENKKRLTYEDHWDAFWNNDKSK
jgi:hypothetical protein